MAYTDQERDELFALFLREYAKCGVKGLAFDRAGLRRHTGRDWIEQYPKYKTAFEEIQEVFVDGLEEVAIIRAKEKSDSLLMFLLKAKRPEEYTEKKELQMSGAGKIELVFAEGMLTDEEKAMIKKESLESTESS